LTGPDGTGGSAAGSPSQATAEAQAPSTTVLGLSGPLSQFRASPASCSRAGGFFTSSGSGEILGVGVATVSSGGLVRDRVAVLTPVGAAVLGFAQRLVDTSGSSTYPLLVASGRLVEPAGSCVAPIAIDDYPEQERSRLAMPSGWLATGIITEAGGE